MKITGGTFGAIKMYSIVLQHKYCGMVKSLQGESLAKIAKDNNIDYNIWVIKGIEQL